MANVLVIADTQEPFSHVDYFAFVKAVNSKYKCDVFVHVGDEVDFHALGQWDHDPDGYSPGHELAEAIKAMAKWYKEFPRMKMCTSNHTARPFRKAFKAGIPMGFLKEYREFLRAPAGWEWRDFWEIDGVLYEHGEGFSGREGAVKCAEGNMQNTVIGHIHSHAGIQYKANSKHLFFGMNVGCGIDKDAYAFKYGKMHKTKPVLSCGVVINGQPILVPMKLNRRGRWIGRL
jgi:hypothetical protein